MNRCKAQPKPTAPRDQAAGSLGWMLALLFLCGLPDAMVVPVLKQLLVDRYGISVGAAHLFMAVNLIGAGAATLVIGRLRLLATTGRIICVAALANAALLALLALPCGVALTFFLRTLEGAADIIVYALLFDLISRTGPAGSRGSRMGLGAMVMMLGIAAGMAVGGMVGANRPVNTLWAGALACLLASGASFFGLPAAACKPWMKLRTARELEFRPDAWAIAPALVMMFSDRAVASLFVATLPLYLTSVIGLSPAVAGGLIGASMLVLAIGTWPIGLLVDRAGAVRVRIVSSVIYAALVGSFSFAFAWSLALGTAVIVLVGLGGAGLFASSLMLVSRQGGRAGAMGVYYAAGNGGFFVGPLLAGWLITVLGGAHPMAAAYHAVFWGFAGMHLVLGGVGVALMAWARQAQPAMELEAPVEREYRQAA